MYSLRIDILHLLVFIIESYTNYQLHENQTILEL